MFQRKISRENLIGNTLEVSLPLSSLLGLKLQGELHHRFMNLVYPLIKIENPMKQLEINEQEKTYLEALLELESITQIISIENINDLTLKNLKNDVIYTFDQKFNELRNIYSLLDKETAKRFINKSLYFIINSEEEGKLIQFIKAAKHLSIPQDSDLIFYNNWFLIGEKIRDQLNSSLESIEQRIEGIEYENIACLKEELQDKAKDYIMILKQKMDVEEIQRLISNDEISLLKIANNLVTHGSIILPKLKEVTAHTGKDLNDLIKFQFPNKNQHLIEEASNSKDAEAAFMRYTFFANGLVMEDDGQGMDKDMFFKEYPFPYISIKKGGLNIGRFGIGSKSKHVEVLEHRGEIFVESKTEDQEALMQRYFMFNSELYIGFSLSNRDKRGTRITILMPKKTKEDKTNQKNLIAKKLRYFNPNRISIISGRRKVNKDSVLKRESEIETIIYNEEKNRVYFNPEKTGNLVLLSGEVLINEIQTPFELVMEIPLQFQPIEGRNDFVYDENIRIYLAEVFRKAILPKLGRENKRCAEWFITNNIHQNPFYQFEQFATREEMIRFYKSLNPEKELTERSKIVNIQKGETKHLNEIVPRDIFIKNREHKSDYILSIEDYAQLSKNEDIQKVTETQFFIKKALTNYKTSLYFSNGFLMKKNREIIPIYLPNMNHDDPFYFNRINNFLLINMNHKSFGTRDEDKKDFYLSQMLRIAVNG